MDSSCLAQEEIQVTQHIKEPKYLPGFLKHAIKALLYSIWVVEPILDHQ